MKRLLIFLLILSSIDLSAQKKPQDLVDSILQVLPTLKEDTNKVNLIVSLSEQLYYVSKLNEGISYLKEGLALAEKLNWKKGMADCYGNLGAIVVDKGNIIQ